MPVESAPSKASTAIPTDASPSPSAGTPAPTASQASIASPAPGASAFMRTPAGASPSLPNASHSPAPASVPAPPAAPAAAQTATTPGPAPGTSPSPEPAPASPAGGAQSPGEVNRKIEMLQRQGRQLHEQRKALERQNVERLNALKAQEAELARQKAEVEKVLASKRDPIAWLQAGGFTYEQAAQQVLAGGKPTPETLVTAESAKLQAEIAREREAREKAEASWREEQEKLAKQLEEAKQADQQRQYNEFRQGTLSFVAQNAEKYELTARLPNGAHEVQRLIETAYARDAQIAEQEGREPRIMSREQAAQAVEDYLRGQLDAASQTKYFLSKFKPVEQPAPTLPALQYGSQPAAPAAAAAPAEEQQLPQTFERRTLSGSQPTITNAVVATPRNPATGQFRRLSEEERMAAAGKAYDDVMSRRSAS